MTYVIKSSNGELHLDDKGEVTAQNTSPECSKVVRFDLDEYKEVWGHEPPEEIDILDIRGILEDGSELVWSEYKVKRNATSSLMEKK